MSQVVPREIEFRDAPRSVREIRNEGRVRIRVGCRPTQQVLPGGHMVEHGESEVVVYSSDLPAIEALIEDESSEIKACVAASKRNEQRHYERYYNKPLSDVTEDERKRKPYPGSVEYEFNQRLGRDIRPLTFVEKLEELAAPDEALRSHGNMIEQLAKSMARELVAATQGMKARSKS